MPPHSISVVDDGDDWVVLPHGVTSRYHMRPANDMHPDKSKSSKESLLAYAADEQGRKTHALTCVTDGIENASAVDTSSDFDQPSQLQKESKQIAFEDGTTHHHDKEDFGDADIGEKAAYAKVMAKVKKAQQTGKHTAMGHNWNLQLVDHNETASAVDDSSSIVGQVGALNIAPPKTLRKSAARTEEAQLTTVHGSIRKSEQQDGKQPARNSARVTFIEHLHPKHGASGEPSSRVTQNSEPQPASGEHSATSARANSRVTPKISTRDQLRRQVAQRNITPADHQGGVPVMTRPRPMSIVVAHKLSDEELRAMDPPEIRCLEEAVTEVPRFGFLIPCRDGRMKLVGGDAPAYACVGSEARHGCIASSHERADYTPNSVNQITPQAITAQAPTTQAIAALAPTSPAVESTNYQAPTVESASDIGNDLGGLFD